MTVLERQTSASRGPLPKQTLEIHSLSSQQMMSVKSVSSMSPVFWLNLPSITHLLTCISLIDGLIHTGAGSCHTTKADVMLW